MPKRSDICLEHTVSFFTFVVWHGTEEISELFVSSIDIYQAYDWVPRDYISSISYHVWNVDQIDCRVLCDRAAGSVLPCWLPWEYDRDFQLHVFCLSSLYMTLLRHSRKEVNKMSFWNGYKIVGHDSDTVILSTTRLIMAEKVYTVKIVLLMQEVVMLWINLK